MSEGTAAADLEVLAVGLADPDGDVDALREVEKRLAVRRVRRRAGRYPSLSRAAA
ncbi:hypothetical protein ACFYYN_42180 [Streptomyces sp. NPDC001902]